MSMSATRSLLLILTALVLPAPAGAQVVKVTATPAAVDMTNREQVTVAAAAEADRPRLLQATKARVDGTEVTTTSTATGVTLRPPAVAVEGNKTVTLLDAANATVAEFALQYRAAQQNVTAPGQPAVIPGERERLDRLASHDWYLWLIILIFLLVVGPFVFAIVMSVYRGHSELNADNRPLGLPVGSFRSILAYSLVAYLGFYVLTSVLSLSRFDPPEFLLGIVATVIGFYFGSRSEEATGQGVTAIVRGIVTQGTAPARGAIVKFTRVADGADIFSRITDVNGRFELTGAAPGKYKVRATVIGAPPSDEQEITLSAGSDHEIAIEIKQPPAPQPGSVQGSVTKPDGTPAAGATVSLTQGGVEKFKKVSGTTGEYKIEGLPAGDYQLQASLATFGSSDPSAIKVSAGATQTVNARLK